MKDLLYKHEVASILATLRKQPQEVRDLVARKIRKLRVKAGPRKPREGRQWLLSCGALWTVSAKRAKD